MDILKLGDKVLHNKREAVVIQAVHRGGNNIDYQIRFLDTGNTLAWVTISKLIFCGYGGIELILFSEKIYDEINDKSKNLKFIIENFSNINSISINYLFLRIGYKSAFIRTGEYFHLYDDWNRFKHIFESLIEYETWVEILTIYPNLFVNKETVEYQMELDLFNEIKDIQKTIKNTNE